jgi:hypothetical protein
MESENIKALLDYIPEEIERLARIGRAFEKALKEEFPFFELTDYEQEPPVLNFYPIRVDEFNRVIKWAESED